MLACYKFFDVNICSYETGDFKNTGNFLPLTLHVKMTSQFLKICTEDRKKNFGLVVCVASMHPPLIVTLYLILKLHIYYVFLYVYIYYHDYMSS